MSFEKILLIDMLTDRKNTENEQRDMLAAMREHMQWQTTTED